MNDTVWLRDEIESPCVNICVIDEANGLCIGCGRKRAEIASWSRMTAEDRRATMDKLPARMEAAKPQRRGGRNRNR